MAQRFKVGDVSKHASQASGSEDTPPLTPNPHNQISPLIHSRLRLFSRGSDSTVRSVPLSRLLRRNRPQLPPIEVSELTFESPPLTVVESPPRPPLPSPLLAGCPGREISGAKSDGREWACDFDEPPVLGYPDDLSETEFHEHPLAQHIELEKGWEKQQLALYGLILPAKVDNGTPTYTWESDPEDEEDLGKALVLSAGAKTPVNTPSQTERPRTPSNILYKVKSFANFVATSDLEKDVPELPTLKELLDQFGMPPGTPTESAPPTFLRTTRSSGSLRPKTPLRSVPSATKLRNKRSSGIDKSQISDPVAPEELRRVGAEFSQTVARRKGTSDSDGISNYAASLRSPSNLISPSITSNLPLYLLQPQHPTVYFGKNEPPPEFRLAPPRLSPMEYARQYLIAKAKADRQGDECLVRKPDLTWAWTEHYKEFLLLPHIPEGVQRNFLPDEATDWKKSGLVKTVAVIEDKDTAKRRSFIPLPLNLTPTSPLLPAHLRSSSYSTVSPAHQRDLSIDAFSLDRPEPAGVQTLLQSTKSLVTDPLVSIPGENTGLFVAVQRSSESEFTRSFPPQFLSALSVNRNAIIRQEPLVASERQFTATPPTRAFTATLADPSCITARLTPDIHHPAGFYVHAASNRPLSVASSQKTITTATTAVAPAYDHQDLHVSSSDIIGETCSEATVARWPSHPGSGRCRSYSNLTTIHRDENNVSPNITSDDFFRLPAAPVSPLNNSPASAQTEVFAPLQVTRTLESQHTWDDAQTQNPADETFLQIISDDGADVADTSSVYSEDSIITAVHLPLAGRRHTPLDFMPLADTALENGEEDMTPRQRDNLDTDVPRSRSRTSQGSPILRPLSYVPDTEVAQSYTSSENPQEQTGNRPSQAAAGSVGTLSTSVTGSTSDERGRHSVASHASSDSASITSASISASCRSQNPAPAPDSLSDRSAGRNHTRRSRTKARASDATHGTSYDDENDSRFPDLGSVAERPSSSPGLRASATSPAVGSIRRASQKPLPKRPDSTRKDNITQALESRNSGLPPIQARRRRAVANLPQIPVSQAYPQPLRVSAMKSPSPAIAASTTNHADVGTGSGTVARSTSRLITDIGNELDREMEEVLSPRASASIRRSQSPDVEDDVEDDVETPTRRPPRKARSMKSMSFDVPTSPAPNKPLPSLPEQKAQSEAPSQAFVDADFGPGPAVSYTPTSPASPPPIPPRRRPIAAAPKSPTEWTSDYVTRADFSIKRDRTVRPAASVAAFSTHESEYLSSNNPSMTWNRSLTTDAAPSLDHRPQQARRQEPAASLQRPAPAPAPAAAPTRTRLLGKMVSMADLKRKRETGSSSSDDAVGMRTFLDEDSTAAPAPAKEKTSEGGSKKKFFGNLFRRSRKDGEK